MKAAALEKSLILIIVYIVKLHPTIHILTLLTLIPPVHARLHLFGLSYLSPKSDSEESSKGENNGISDSLPNRKSTWESLCSGPHT